MQRQEFISSPLSPRMQAAYDEELYRRNYFNAQQPQQLYGQRSISSRRMAEILLNERRHSFDLQPDYPMNPKFMHPSMFRAPPMNYTSNESINSMNSLLESDYDGSDMDVVGMRSRINHPGISYYANATPIVERNEMIDTTKVVQNLTAFSRFLEMMQRWPLPRLSFNTAGIFFLLAIFMMPRTCADSILFPAFRLSFGTLYPAYASYKAVRTKNVKEYVKWMMYWIVFAFFTCAETFTDIFLSWFPFYYEVKVVIVLWLLSPATRGSSILYRKFVHPMLTKREQDIDEYINQAKERGYSVVLTLGTKGMNYATNVIMQTAIKGGGNLVQTIKRSYSLSDLSEPEVHRTQDEIDAVSTVRPQQRILRPRPNGALSRSTSGTRHSTGMYFTEVEFNARGDFNSHNIRSSDDISSGYSSTEATISTGLSRTSSMTNASKTRLKSKRIEEGVPNEPVQPINYPLHVLRDKWGNEVYLENDLEFQNTVAPEVVAFQNLSHDAIFKKPFDAQTDSEQCESEKSEIIDNSNRIVFEFRDDRLSLDGSTSSLSNSIFEDPTSPMSDSDSENEFSDAILMANEDSEFKKSSVSPPRKASVLPVTESKETTPVPDIDVVEKEEIKEEVPDSELVEKQETKEEESKVSSKNLRDTLEEIKETIRVTLQVPTADTPIFHETPNRRPLMHGKGKAPPPPLPPRYRNNNVDVSSRSSSRSISPSPRRSIFKNIKSSIFRHNNDEPNNVQIVDENVSTKPDTFKETFI